MTSVAVLIPVENEDGGNEPAVTIHRVPSRLRDQNPSVYIPKMILIGPLQYTRKKQARKAVEFSSRQDDTFLLRSQRYIDMEVRKKQYLDSLCSKSVDSEFLTKQVERMEPKIRKCYAESTRLIPIKDFVEMVVLDAAFIIGFMLEEEAQRVKVPSIKTDLILLENQLPFFVLEELWKLVGSMDDRNFDAVCANFFNTDPPLLQNKKFFHLTDFYRATLISSSHLTPFGWTKTTCSYTARKLFDSGLKVETMFKTGRLTDMEVDGTSLFLYPLVIDDETEDIYSNLVALEQLHYPYEGKVSSFLLFMSSLIRTADDVKILLDRGVFYSTLSHQALVASMFEKVSSRLRDTRPYYHEIILKLEKHYESPLYKLAWWRISMGTLNRNYFSDVWTGSATVGALLVIILTLIGTIASVLQVKGQSS